MPSIALSYMLLFLVVLAPVVELSNFNNMLKRKNRNTMLSKRPYVYKNCKRLLDNSNKLLNNKRMMLSLRYAKNISLFGREKHLPCLFLLIKTAAILELLDMRNLVKRSIAYLTNCRKK